MMATETMRSQGEFGRTTTSGGGDWLSPPQAIPLEIGPFLSHSDMLRFAAQLEAQAGIRRLELEYAGPRTARFTVFGPSAAAVATAIAELGGVRISAVAADNAVIAHVHDSMPRALQVLAPPTTRRRRLAILPAWATSALFLIPLLVLAPLAVGAAVFFASSDFQFGGGSSGSTFAATTPIPQGSSVPAIVITPPEATAAPGATIEVTPTPEATPEVPAATAEATAEATPEATVVSTPAPTVVSTPAPTAQATPEPTAVVVVVQPSSAPTELYRASFSGSLGTLTAVNGCAWTTPFTGTIDLPLQESSNGRLSGQGSTSVTIRYVVTNTPSGTTCNPGTVSASASGPAGETGSRMVSTMFGDRDFEVEFNGSMSGNTITGTVDLQRRLSTASPFGDTHEMRNTTITNVRFTRVN